MGTLRYWDKYQELVGPVQQIGLVAVVPNQTQQHDGHKRLGQRVIELALWPKQDVGQETIVEHHHEEHHQEVQHLGYHGVEGSKGEVQPPMELLKHPGHKACYSSIKQRTHQEHPLEHSTQDVLQAHVLVPLCAFERCQGHMRFNGSTEISDSVCCEEGRRFRN